MKLRRGAIIAALGAVAAGTFAWAMLSAPRGGKGPSPDYPGGHPIDAAQIQAGTLPLKVMPPEVTGALELHSDEIVKTAELVATKQARISGTCPPGSAIRLVGEDGSVVCQRLPKGVVSVAAVTAVPRTSTTGTAQGTVPGGVGRFQTSGADDFLVAPIQLPDGATVTGFSYTWFDADERVDGAAWLYRSDDSVMAGAGTQGASADVRRSETAEIKDAKVDNATFGYFVYFQVSAEASSNLIPIAAAVHWRLQ